MTPSKPDPTIRPRTHWVPCLHICMYMYVQSLVCVICSPQSVLCAVFSLCYVQSLVCVMCSLQFVLRAAFSLCYVQLLVCDAQSLVCVMCRLQSRASSLRSEHASLRWVGKVPTRAHGKGAGWAQGTGPRDGPRKGPRAKTQAPPPPALRQQTRSSHIYNVHYIRSKI